MSSRNQAFISYLYSLANKRDLQALAVLRRSLARAPGEDFAAYRYIGAFLPEDDRRLRVLCLVAGLFAASKPDDVEYPSARSLGKSLSLLCARDASARNGIERRVAALLNSHLDDLPEHLRHTVARLTTAGERIDWLSLCEDLQFWESQDRWVQRRWAKDFWGSPPKTETETNSELY
jgi:CRISPR system Cascade subunit CasB